jgi:hypothetical protein
MSYGDRSHEVRMLLTASLACIAGPYQALTSVLLQLVRRPTATAADQLASRALARQWVSSCNLLGDNCSSLKVRVSRPRSLHTGTAQPANSSLGTRPVLQLNQEQDNQRGVANALASRDAQLFRVRSHGATRSGYRESLFASSNVLVVRDDLSSQQVLKVPLARSETDRLARLAEAGGKGSSVMGAWQRPEGTSIQATGVSGTVVDRRAVRRASLRAQAVLAKLVGGLTKDGKRHAALVCGWFNCAYY